MSKVTCKILLLVIMAFSFSANAFWFEIPNENQTLSSLGRVEKLQRALNPDRIDVLVWNIYKGGLLSWRIDLQRFAYGRDLILLQEGILNNDMRDELDASTRHQFLFATSFVYKTSGHATGVVTGATAIPSQTDYLRSDGRELIGFSPKMTLVTKYPLRGMDKELMVINIHELNSVSWKKMAAQIIPALRQAAEHDGPVLFAGDFNTWSKKKEAFVMRAMERSGFKPIELANPQDRMHVFGRALDYIFVRGLKARNGKVLVEALGSDHKPLSAILSVIRD
ncbi:MAG: hypothetical protein CME71_10425 [Halobacteriovorax sp.]|nr:hypothetical protein [Halobacteriovorax sp.]